MILEFGIFSAIVFIFLLVFIFKSIYLVRQSEVMVIEKFGKFNRVLHPGIHFVIPFMETPHEVTWTFTYQGEGKRYYRVAKRVMRIDMREAVYDFPKQNVITKDNVTMEINALLYYQITDPKAAIYEVYDLAEAIEKLTQTMLRNVIGSLDLDTSLVSRDEINEKLRIILDEATDKWGVKVNRVELQEVNPPADIRQAMEKQMRAERDRRAVILEAEGKKRAAILEAEGAQESAVLDARGEAESKAIRAQGEADARLKIVEAEAKAIEMIQKAVPGADPLPYMIALNYIKMMPELTAGKNDKLILVPYEASSLAGSLTAMKKMFEEIK
jgi:regulator of protease activity HflC (stomatin/prohibitin superfamily)